MLLEITPDCPTRSPPRRWVGPEGRWGGACPAPRPRPTAGMSSPRVRELSPCDELGHENHTRRCDTGSGKPPSDNGPRRRARPRLSAFRGRRLRHPPRRKCRSPRFSQAIKTTKKKSKKKASVRDMPQWRCVSFTRLGVSEWTSTHVQRGRFQRAIAEQKDRAKSFSDCRPKAGFQTGLQRFQSPRAELRLLCVCLISHGSDVRSERSSHPWGSSCRLVVTIFQRVLLPRSLPASVFWGCAVFKLLKN